MSHRIAIIGSGYVGTVVAACLAHIGHSVIAIEVNQTKLRSLQASVAPSTSLGSVNCLRRCRPKGACVSRQDSRKVSRTPISSSFVLALPQAPTGSRDLSAIRSAGECIAANLSSHHVIVNKSTVPIGTGRWLMTVIEQALDIPNAEKLVSIVSNPEFLREGNSIHDFFYPDRVVIGGDNGTTLDFLTEVYRPLLEHDFPRADRARGPIPLLRTSLATAEMTKYASNTFLATKIQLR